MATARGTKKQRGPISDQGHDEAALQSVARELYGLPRDAFVAARTKHVRQLRADGERQLAARVAKLRKPTAVAAAVNMAVRREPTAARDLVELVADMQRAGSARASADRHDDLVRALVDAARSELRAARESTSASRMADIAAAIRSAALDSDADAFVEARLAQEPSPTDDTLEAALRAGMAGVSVRPGSDMNGADAREPGDPGSKDAADARTALREERRRTKAELAEAKQLARAAAADLREAERDLKRAERALEQARAAREDATEADEHARRRVEEAQAALDDLPRTISG